MAKRLRDNKFLLYSYWIYQYLFYFPFLGMGWSLMFVMFMILIALGNRTVASKIAILWARYGSFITPMSVRIIGIENIDPKKSYVMVANHQSQYDIFVLYGWLPVDFKWVLKIELKKVPIIGPACVRLGHIFIDRKDRDAALKSINDAKNKIKNGTSIMFFPEGTRSESGELLEFKKGAFKFAIAIGLPILPMTIIGTRDILPDNTTALFPGKATLIIHQPIPIKGYRDSTIGSLMTRTIETIQKGLDQYKEQ